MSQNGGKRRLHPGSLKKSVDIRLFPWKRRNVKITRHAPPLWVKYSVHHRRLNSQIARRAQAPRGQIYKIFCIMAEIPEILESSAYRLKFHND